MVEKVEKVEKVLHLWGKPSKWWICINMICIELMTIPDLRFTTGNLAMGHMSSLEDGGISDEKCGFFFTQNVGTSNSKVHKFPQNRHHRRASLVRILFETFLMETFHPFFRFAQLCFFYHSIFWNDHTPFCGRGTRRASLLLGPATESFRTAAAQVAYDYQMPMLLWSIPKDGSWLTTQVMSREMSYCKLQKL